jgi:LysR family transcriptional regulator for bpeEF and oprC
MSGTILDLNELRVFAAVAARRSFVAASRDLGIPKATVSRKVQDLEERLGVKLLERTTRRVSLTEAGMAFQERCTRIEEEIADAESAVGTLSTKVRGTLRVTCPFTLANALLVPILPEFLSRYPEVRVVLTLRIEPEDLVGRGVDVALAPWPLPDTALATRLLGVAQTGLYASPAYVEKRGMPRTSSDLARHATLLYARGGKAPTLEWRLRHGPRVEVIPLKPVMVCNDMTPLLAAARQGTGILFADAARAGVEVHDGTLVPVMAGWSGQPLEVRAVFPSRAGLLPKSRAFIDFLAERTRTILRAIDRRSPLHGLLSAPSDG